MSLSRAAAVLDWMRRNNADVGVSELSVTLGWPKSSTSRLLKDMAAVGLLRRDEASKRYRVGLMMVELGRHYGSTDVVLERADAALSEETRQTGHSTGISTLDGRDIVVLRSRSGTNLLRFVTPPGTRGPAFVTSTGWALLAELDDATIAKLMTPFPRSPQPGGPRSLPELMQRIDAVRRRGWAEAVDEWVPGISAISVAIRATEYDATYALYITFTTGQAAAPERARLARRLLAVADAINGSSPGRQQHPQLRKLAHG